MGHRWPRVIRDPVHDIVPFEDTPCDRLLLVLINTREFQRLRRIRQLGMSEMVFPGANHSRFAHSIGVMHVARRILERVETVRGQKKKLEEEQKTAVLAAALLHDIGHGPFSHAFEKVAGQKHEARTLEIILDRKTEVGKSLRKHSAGRARDIAKKAKLKPEYAFIAETAADTPYKPYAPDSDRPASEIFVETNDGRSVEVSTLSDALVPLRKPYRLVRYYFPERLRERIVKAAMDTIRKEDTE